MNTKQETPSKLIERLVGDWERDNSGNDTNKQRITFTSEARYIIYENDQKIDSGAYRMNEQLHNIYLESEVNEQPREYEISLTRDELKLTPNQPNGQQESASSTYRRAQ